MGNHPLVCTLVEKPFEWFEDCPIKRLQSVGSMGRKGQDNDAIFFGRIHAIDWYVGLMVIHYQKNFVLKTAVNMFNKVLQNVQKIFRSHPSR